MYKHASGAVTAVLGASGYVGRELVHLLAGHGGVALRFATSESETQVDGVRATPLAQADQWLGEAEVVFSCLPHGLSGASVDRARRAGARVVDLSADLRLSPEAVYGLTEVNRGAVTDAPVVANPGCYPTVSLLGILPFAKAGVVDSARAIVINAASGVTGAGRSPKRELMFGEVAEDYRAYAVGNEHRHLPEIRRTLGGYLGDVDVVFTPHLLPVRRGILATILLPLLEPMTREAAEATCLDAYDGEPCVSVVRGGAPTLRDVVYRNRVAIGVAPVEHVRRPAVTVVAAIDNLVKGAAGQAVQNMNVMLGFDETRGLVC